MNNHNPRLDILMLESVTGNTPSYREYLQVLSILEGWHPRTLAMMYDNPCIYCGFVVTIPSTRAAQNGHLSSRLCKGCWNRMHPRERRGRRERRWHYDFRDRVMIAGCGLFCGICGVPGNMPGTGIQHYVLHIDHDYMTQLVRGLLCMACNTLVGRLEGTRFRRGAGDGIVDPDRGHLMEPFNLYLRRYRERVNRERLRPFRNSLP